LRLSNLRTVFPVICSFAIVAVLVVLAMRNPVLGKPRQLATATSLDVMPRYDPDRNLVLPDDYRRWVLVGSSLGLSYSEGGQGGHQMFNTTLMEPSAYQHFVETGTFREGTMFALIGQGIGTNTTPARQGQFATDVHMVEMAVKDSKRVPESWAYYGFGGPMMGGYRSTAAPQPKASCFNCHAEHAARDNVFVQFYGLLNEAAPKKQ
jgi:Cytochrome P460